MDEELKLALTNFYTLKRDYEKTNKGKIMKKCVVCKQNGGTVFTQTKNRLTALCGSSTSPCRLHIEILRGLCENIRETFDDTYEEYVSIRKDIIKRKLQHLYNEFDDISDIPGLLDEYKSIANYKSELHKDLLERINNTKNLGSIKEKNTEMENILSVISEKIKTHTPSNSNITDIIKIYQSDVMPLTVDRMNLKYKSIQLYKVRSEKDNPIYDPGTIALIQRIYDNESMEIQTLDPTIISNVVSK